ncbi:unnamed protein product [Prorocentrum cordatum]|uniref:Uncharacterized protein n=1 Tax=Prorocentrum cordatum TaxID=2364126 RepID=A0ABN9RE60_9DINO|nr:unnamed protein product [Polarella glacialis]
MAPRMQDGIDKDTRPAVGLVDSRRGLDIGRRTLVVVQPGAGHSEGGKPWGVEAQVFGATPALTLQDISRQKHGKYESTVHIVDHGDSQREAVRRLFDAQTGVGMVRGQSRAWRGTRRCLKHLLRISDRCCCSPTRYS